VIRVPVRINWPVLQQYACPETPHATSKALAGRLNR
jgi:hypothetical protein